MLQTRSDRVPVFTKQQNHRNFNYFKCCEDLDTVEIFHAVRSCARIYSINVLISLSSSYQSESRCKISYSHDTLCSTLDRIWFRVIHQVIVQCMGDVGRALNSYIESRIALQPTLTFSRNFLHYRSSCFSHPPFKFWKGWRLFPGSKIRWCCFIILL